MFAYPFMATVQQIKVKSSKLTTSPSFGTSLAFSSAKIMVTAWERVQIELQPALRTTPEAITSQGSGSMEWTSSPSEKPPDMP